jgi:hypothetical protein
MWLTWNTLPVKWTHVIRVVLVSVALVSVVLCVSACTGSTHSSSPRSGMPSEGEYGRSRTSGNGGNGY